MNCIIPGLNVKVFARTLNAFSKIGDELFIEAKEDRLTFITLNQSKTICARCHFLECFFSSFIIGQPQDDVPINCKLHTKVISPIFKGLHLEKKLDYVKLEFESGSDLIYFKMKYKCDDIVMVHKLRLMDPEILSIDINAESGSNNICAPSSFFNELLTVFGSYDDEITLEISKDKVIARNYFVGAPLRPKSVRSQVTLNSSEFTIFRIDKETTLNYSLKPFRTAIYFAETFALNVGLSFETGGQPLAMILKNPTYEVNVIVATLNPYNDAQSTMSAVSIPSKVTQVRAENGHNLTVEDREALATVNWDDDCDIEMNCESDSIKKCKGVKKKPSFQEVMNQVSKKNSVSSDNNRTSGAKEFKFSDNNCEDVVQMSPESPRTKRAKFLFGRCFDPTFNAEMLGEILAPDSDPEDG